MSKLPRDVFVGTVYEAAKKDKNIYFISADLGAQALDDFRLNLPEQFIHIGICEQNMIDVAAGLALAGKKVFVYAMASFITYRCYEQIKVSLSIMNLPVTIIAVGVGYSYDDASPTHYSLEDVSIMRALPNVEIYTPSDTKSTEYIANKAIAGNTLNYVRLDRKFLPNLHNLLTIDLFDNGIVEVINSNGVCIVSCGYMQQCAVKVCQRLKAFGIDSGLIDVLRFTSLEKSNLNNILSKYKNVIIIEEHFLQGGLGSIFAEFIVDNILDVRLKRIGCKQQHFFENGGRDFIHKLSGIDFDTIETQVKDFLQI